MLLRVFFAAVAGLLLAAAARQLLCTAPNPTLADPAYCGPTTGVLTSLTAFLVGAGLVWVIMLWRERARRPVPPRESPPADPRP